MREAGKTKLIEAVLDSGLWQTNEQIITGLASLKSKTAKLKALKCQLDFRKKVLQQTYPFSKPLSRVRN